MATRKPTEARQPRARGLKPVKKASDESNKREFVASHVDEGPSRISSERRCNPYVFAPKKDRSTFATWCTAQRGRDDFRAAIARMEGIFTDGSAEKHVRNILWVCWRASQYSTLADAQTKARRSELVAGKIVPSAIASIKRVRRQLKQFDAPELDNLWFHLFLHFTRTRLVTAPMFGNVDELFGCIERAFNSAFRTRRVWEAAWHGFACLHYPDALAAGRLPDIPTALGFQLAMMFRRISLKMTTDLPASFDEPMPREGKPCYPLVVELLQVVFGAKVPTSAQLAVQIARLARKGVGVWGWPADR
jgi:hypothetical protein